GDDLPARRVVLADPHLVEAQVIEPLDELHVAGHGQGGVLAQPVERCEEDAELHPSVGHSRFSLLELRDAAIPAGDPADLGSGVGRIRFRSDARASGQPPSEVGTAPPSSRRWTPRASTWRWCTPHAGSSPRPSMTWTPPSPRRSRAPTTTGCTTTARPTPLGCSGPG